MLGYNNRKMYPLADKGYKRHTHSNNQMAGSPAREAKSDFDH